MNICENFTPASGPEGERPRGGAGMHALPPDRKFCPGFCPPSRFPICPCRRSRKPHGHKKQPHPIAVRLSDLVRLRPGEIRARQLMKLVKWMSLRTDPFHGGIRSPAACRQAEIQCCHACRSSAVVAGCCQISNAMCTDPAPSAGLQRLAVVESPAFQAGGESLVAAFQTSRFRPDT